MEWGFKSQNVYKQAKYQKAWKQVQVNDASQLYLQIFVLYITIHYQAIQNKLKVQLVSVIEVEATFETTLLVAAGDKVKTCDHPSQKSKVAILLNG